MKVAVVFLLAALALLTLPGSTTADMMEGKAQNCSDEIMECPMTYDPVCGSDEVTYFSECTLCVANRKRQVPVKIKRYGPC